MKVLIIGLGSMGKRRIRIIRKLYADTCMIIGIDGREDRRNECEQLYQISCYANLNDAIKQYHPECAFICTSPLSHAVLTRTCLEAGLHVFSEINLISDGYQENMELAHRHHKLLFLSSTPMYKTEMQYITEKVKGRKPVHYTYHVGQYLPDWHPWENINEFFVSDKRTNGCREIMAIELPWMLNAFGDVQDVSVYADKLTSLNLSYDDSYQLQIIHKNGNKGLVAFDITSRIPIRHLEIYNEQMFIEWFGKPESLKFWNNEQNKVEYPCVTEAYKQRFGYSEMINEMPYEQEVRNFFSCMAGEAVSCYSIERDKSTLSIIDDIEHQAEKKQR